MKVTSFLQTPCSLLGFQNIVLIFGHGGPPKKSARRGGRFARMRIQINFSSLFVNCLFTFCRTPMGELEETINKSRKSRTKNKRKLIKRERIWTPWGPLGPPRGGTQGSPREPTPPGGPKGPQSSLFWLTFFCLFLLFLTC